MKKIFTTVIAAALMATAAIAQPSVGGGFINTTDKANGKSVSLNGFYVGANYNIGIASGLGVAPGIYFNYATKSDAASLGTLVATKSDRSQMFLSAPVMINYGIQLGDSFVLRPYAGPTFAFGLKDQAKYTVSVAGVEGTDKGNLYDNKDYKKFNIQVGGGVAFEFENMIRFDVGYDYGLSDLYKGLKRNQLHAGVAYLF